MPESIVKDSILLGIHHLVFENFSFEQFDSSVMDGQEHIAEPNIAINFINCGFSKACYFIENKLHGSNRGKTIIKFEDSNIPYLIVGNSFRTFVNNCSINFFSLNTQSEFFPDISTKINLLKVDNVNDSTRALLQLSRNAVGIKFCSSAISNFIKISNRPIHVIDKLTKNSLVNVIESSETCNVPDMFNQKNWSQLLSTYKQMSVMPDFEYAKDDIEQYIHYLRSRTSWLHRLLFWFNGAFRIWHWPLVAIFLSAIGIHFLIESLPPYSIVILKGQRLSGITYAWNPIKIMSEVVFHGFGNFGPELMVALKKFGVFVLELLFAFSLFSFGVAMKRKFGFKKLDR